MNGLSGMAKGYHAQAHEYLPFHDVRPMMKIFTVTFAITTVKLYILIKRENYVVLSIQLNV